MRQISLPAYDPQTVLEHCVDAVPAGPIKDKYLLHQAHFDQGITEYNVRSATQTWCDLPRCIWGQPNQVITGSLTKAELVELYDTYMVKANGPSRSVYDMLKVAAGGKCPYCGGIGQVSTLDHYLPKSYFPLHAVNPRNLVPSCQDCNKGKSAAFPLTPAGQGLHPYLDPAHFFTERWVFGTVEADLPVTVQFSAIPPAHWNPTDRSRAEAHFNSNALRRRYSVESGSTLSMIIQWRSTTLRNFTHTEFADHLMEGANNPNLVLNGWERTLYLALAHSPWFCSLVF